MSWFTDHQPPPDPSGLVQGTGDDRLEYADARAAIKNALSVYGLKDATEADVNTLMNAQGIHAGQKVSARYLRDIFQNLYTNAKNQYGDGSGGPAGAPPPAAGGADDGAGVDTAHGHLSGADQHQIDQMLADVQSTDTKDYWYDIAAAHGGVASTGVDWLRDRINRGDGSLLVRNGTLQKFQDNSGGDYTTPARPEDLKTFTPAVWSETYKPPTAEDVSAMPGFVEGANDVARAATRKAAAQGSVLSGGFQGRTLPGAEAAYAGAAYDTLNQNAYDAYMQRYSQFKDANNTSAGAFQMNNNAYDSDVKNSLNQYLTRYGAYQDLIKNNLSYTKLGLDAITSSNPTGRTGAAA